VIIVINGVDDRTLKILNQINGIKLIINKNNEGLATALNQGIIYAFNEISISYVNLFDQDSIPEENLPINLVDEIKTNGYNDCACIGPILVDIKNPNIYYKQNKNNNDRNSPKTLPTSGTLISRESWVKIGAMLDLLFIDGIDHEWCLRAKSLGHQVYLSKKNRMLHNMGDDYLNYFGSYKPIHRSPIRHYYIVRNSLYLMSLKHIPYSWKIIELCKTIRRIPFYLYASDNALVSLRNIIVAINDGILKNIGRKF
jgi:rhamnosyltransferase